MQTHCPGTDNAGLRQSTQSQPFQDNPSLQILTKCHRKDGPTRLPSGSCRPLTAYVRQICVLVV